MTHCGSTIGSDNFLYFIPDTAENTSDIFKCVLPIAGVLHIFANVLKDIDSALPSWNRMHSKLKQWEHLVSNPMRLERFVATCIVPHGPGHERHVEVCRRRYRIMYDKRWGEVHKWLRKTQAVIKAVVLFWDEARFGADRESKPDEDGHVFKPQMVTELIADTWFHGYAQMVLYVGATVESMSDWAELCPCHEEVLRRHGHDHDVGGLPVGILREECGCALASGMTTLSCPFRGCRAPEMAAGAAFEQLDLAYIDALGHLSRECRPAVGTETWASLLQEFAAAKSYMHFILTIKLQNWTELPWLCCALAHHDESKARQGARRILEKLAQVPADAPAILQHHWTRVFAEPRMMQELEAFASGRPRRQLRNLWRATRPLVGIPITERSVEAPHGRVKRSIAYKNDGPLSISMSMRVPDIERDIWPDKVAFDNMCSLCDEALSVRRVPRLLDLHGHPWIRSLHRCRQSSSWVALLSCIIYRCDDVTAFECHADAKHTHDSVQRGKARLAKPYIEKKDVALTLDSVMNKAATDHLRFFSEVNDLYSYRLDPTSPDHKPLINSLRSHMQQPVAKVKPVDMGDFEMGDDECAGQDVVDEGAVVAFKVVAAKPSEKRVQSRGVFVGRKIANTQIAISLANMRTTETGQQMSEVDLGMLDQQKIALVSLQGSTDSWLRENLLVHRDADVDRMSLSYSLKGPKFEDIEPGLLHSVIDGILTALAYHGTDKHFIADEHMVPTLLQLEESGLVCRVEGIAASAWQVLPAAMIRTF